MGKTTHKILKGVIMCYNEETEELRQWLLNDEYFFNTVNNVLNSFEEFKLTVEKFIKVLNTSYDFLNFKVSEINFKSLFNYFNDY